jgi:hypothetical protein
MTDGEMLFGVVWGEPRGLIPTPEERDVLDAHAEELREHLNLRPGCEWEWGLIGDNTLCAHHWAERMQGLGVREQAALRYVQRMFVPKGTP